MNTLTLTAAAPLVALAVLFGASGLAIAQQPTHAQISAIRQGCRADYQTYCASVPTGGSAALACLQQNAQSLSTPCRQAVGAATGSAPSAQTQRPAPAEPATRTPPPPMSPRQETGLLRRACGQDYQAYCSEVPPGGGRIIECLRQNGPYLSRQCRSALISARQGR
jgi:hypothetical protein